MIYIDTSSLLKAVWHEAESEAVRRLIAAEDRVVVSSLTELEAEVQLRAQWLGGGFTKSRYFQYRNLLEALSRIAPFDFREVPTGVFRKAIEQHRAEEKLHCRSLDRLHLAAMRELGLRRLLTNDSKQAAAARAFGFDVMVPTAE